jgi:hypothetical protein
VKPAGWSDFDWALFLLDGNEQSLVDEFGCTVNPDVKALLTQYAERVLWLRRDYVGAKA